MNLKYKIFFKKTKHGKSPGADGFTCEFKFFGGKDLGTFITREINQFYKSNQFSEPNKLGNYPYTKTWQTKTISETLAPYKSFECYS